MNHNAMRRIDWCKDIAAEVAKLPWFTAAVLTCSACMAVPVAAIVNLVMDTQHVSDEDY